MKTTIRNIGFDVKGILQKPSQDRHDPFFQSFGVRGRMFTAKVLSTKASKTAKVEFERIFPLPKFERFEKRRTRLQVHNPDSMNAQIGDLVRIMECRPISKTKNFVIIEVLKRHESS